MSKSLPTRMFTALHFRPGPSEEPRVENKDFLLSFLSVGVWTRCITLSDHVEVLRKPNPSPLKRYASTIGVYQELGLLTEDAIATLVAWSLWSSDKSQSLADIVYRLILARDAQGASHYTRARMEKVKADLVAGGKIRLDGRRYLQGLLNGVPERDLPTLLGVPWSRTPSVKLVPRQFRLAWQSLPAMIADHVRVLTDSSNELTTAYFNKLKHGPQLVIQNPRRVAESMKIARADLESIPDRNMIRLLFNGSRTAISHAELSANKRTAPFLLDDGDNARALLHGGAIKTALFMWFVGRFLFGCSFKGMEIPDLPVDSSLEPLIEENLRPFI
jgi:hypothetical protein